MATFYIEALEDMTIALSWYLDVAPDVVVKYGINDMSVPNDYIIDDEISLTAGQKCYWFANFDEAEDSSSAQFYGEGKFNVGGNLSDLIDGNTIIPFDYEFCNLFSNSEVVDASELVVIDDFNGTEGCYMNMFLNCTSLTSPPELPATSLANYCYMDMFSGCTSLTTLPELPATTLAFQCYAFMFEGCTSLTTPPELPATTLADRCYEGMFSNCTSLTTPSELPATTLADYCYSEMFSGCTNIKLSEIQTDVYRTPYRIPTSDTGAIGSSSLDDMFTDTGGTFTGTPTINTTYYIYNDALNVQLKDGELKLLPRTKIKNIVDFPSVLGNSGKVLMSKNGDVSWEYIKELPDVTSIDSGKLLVVDENGEWVAKYFEVDSSHVSE